MRPFLNPHRLSKRAEREVVVGVFERVARLSQSEFLLERQPTVDHQRVTGDGIVGARKAIPAAISSGLPVRRSGY